MLAIPNSHGQDTSLAALYKAESQVMSDHLDYSRQELQSYLPTGWNLAEASDTGSWDHDQSSWTVLVRDNAGLTWPLKINESDVKKMGRLEALRESAGRLFREALG